MNDSDDLLSPSLGGSKAPATAIYTATTGYVAAFLGGPVAGAIIALLNARRLQRLSKDWPLALLAVALLYTFLWWELRSGGDEWLVSHLGRTGPSALYTVVGLLFFCGTYLLHYTSYRSMQILGLKAPSGWVPGVVAVIIGVGVRYALTSILQT
ncbi:MAG: hypothetical protein WDO56_21490 [Gammaproteobacteria bacterium]